MLNFRSFECMQLDIDWYVDFMSRNPKNLIYQDKITRYWMRMSGLTDLLYLYGRMIENT
jgi:hypothetical protein